MAAPKSERGGMWWASKQHFVLVHGITGGAWTAWCWFKVKCQLEAFGCHVTCLDLKGCGTDPTDPSTIETFDEYNQPLHHFLASLPNGHKVVLVGHSAGGISVTRAIQSFPHKIQMAIYVCTTMLKFGFQSDDDHKINRECPNSIMSDTNMKKDPKNIAILASRNYLCLNLSLQFNRLFRAPFRAIATSKFKEDETRESESVPRVYIKTLRDRVLEPHKQEVMIERWETYHVYSVETDHDLLFADPVVISGLLIRAVSSLSFEMD